MKLPVVLAALIGILGLACSTVTRALVEPTPNIDATVEARLAEERAVDAIVQAQPANTLVTAPTDIPKQGPIGTITPAPSFQELYITSIGDRLLYDVESLKAYAGQSVSLVFENTSTNNQHNWVLVKTGTKDEVATAGTSAGPRAGWIPPGDDRVLAASGLLDPGATEQVSFTAPAPGSYQFVCTFPGHNFTMFGEFKILEAPKEFAELEPTPTHALTAVPTPTFVPMPTVVPTPIPMATPTPAWHVQVSRYTVRSEGTAVYGLVELTNSSSKFWDVSGCLYPSDKNGILNLECLSFSATVPPGGSSIATIARGSTKLYSQYTSILKKTKAVDWGIGQNIAPPPNEIFEIQNGLITNKTAKNITIELKYSYTETLDRTFPDFPDTTTRTQWILTSQNVPARSAVSTEGGTGGWDTDMSQGGYNNDRVWKVIYK